MTRAEVAKMFLILTHTYPNFTADEDKIIVWHECLKDYPFDQAMKNLREHINTCKYLPTVSEIRKPLRDPAQFTDYARLKQETEERLRQWDEWQERAALPPGGGLG